MPTWVYAYGGLAETANPTKGTSENMKSLANIELIWALFIIITVVAQIVKGAKKVASQAPGKTEEGAPPGSPRETPDRGTREDELRKFLETLAGGQPQPPKPAAAPPPIPHPARQQAPTVRRQPATVRQQPPTVRRPKPGVATQAPEQAPYRAVPSTDSTVTRHRATAGAVAPASMHVETARAEMRTSALQAMLKKELQGVAARRKAIVLREILGPPHALKPLEWRV